MYERDLTDENNDDTVVTIPQLAEGQEESAPRCRSRVTQYGNTSLEIEIPRTGIESGDRWSILLLPSIPASFLLTGIPLTVIGIFLLGPDGLFFLLFVAFPLLAYYNQICGSKYTAFSQTILTITRDSYSLLQKNITWCSFLQILCIPSHFDDLENGNAIETVLEDSQHPRLPSLQAEVVTDEEEDTAIKHIKLGSITFARGLSNDEVEWLAEEINRFLRETS